MDRVISLLLANIKLRIYQRRMKQRIRELRFPTKKPNPLLAQLSTLISPYALGKVREQIAIMEKLKAPYEYQLDEVTIHQ